MKFCHRLLLAALCFVVILQFCYAGHDRKSLGKKLADKRANVKAKLPAFRKDLQQSLQNVKDEVAARLHKFHPHKAAEAAESQEPTQDDVGKIPERETGVLN